MLAVAAKLKLLAYTTTEFTEFSILGELIL